MTPAVATPGGGRAVDRQLQLPATLTQTEVQPWLEGALTAVAPNAVWRVDAGALQRFDTTTLAAVLAVRRHVMAAGARFEIQAAPPRLMALAQVYGVAHWLT